MAAVAVDDAPPLGYFGLESVGDIFPGAGMPSLDSFLMERLGEDVLSVQCTRTLALDNLPVHFSLAELRNLLQV